MNSKNLGNMNEGNEPEEATRSIIRISTPMNLPISAKRNIDPRACIISENIADTNTKYSHSSQAEGHPSSGRTPRSVTPIVNKDACRNEVSCQTNVLPKNVLNVPLFPFKYLLFLITNVAASAPAHNDIDTKNGENPFP